MSTRSTTPLVTLVTSLALAGCASTNRAAQDEGPRSPRTNVSLTIENDAFTGSDNNYTNGFGLTFQSSEYRKYEEDSFQREWVDFWSFLPHIGNENCQVFSARTVMRSSLSLLSSL